MASTSNTDGEARRNAECEELSMRLHGYISGALTSNLIMLGERLGLYSGLSELGPCTSDDLAAHLGLSPRYTAEWLRQQSAAKLISCDDTAHKFWLTEPQKDVLVREYGKDASPFFSLGLTASLPTVMEVADKILPNIFRTGEGFVYDAGGEPVACGVCRELGAWIRYFLVDRLKSLPGNIAEKLESGCAVADVGCGCGEAIMAAASAFPFSQFQGFDISETALNKAREVSQTRNLANTKFINPGIDERGMGESCFDIVMTHDAIHDMTQPQEVMNSVCKAIKPGGIWVIGDMMAGESHAQNIQGHPMAHLMYGFSCHLCLPSALSSPNGAGLGTLGLSPSLAEKMLRNAGFEKFEILDWGHPLNRYYLATKA